MNFKWFPIVFFVLLLKLWSTVAYAKDKAISLNPKHFLTFQLHRENFFFPAYRAKGATGAYQDTEVKYQFSFLIQLVAGKRHSFSFAYTQKSFWQLYDGKHSNPFRETNYNPQFFYRYNLGVLLFDMGYEHESNGEEDPMSRSWDRGYARIVLRSFSFKLSLKYWAVLLEDYYGPECVERLDPLIRYLGRSELAITWHIGRLMFRHRGRYNFSSGYGFQEHMLLYPWSNNRIFWTIAYSKGYGDSLRDYNHSLESYGIGLLINP